MIDIKSTADLRRLRRIALDSQGLTRTQPFGRGLNGARKAIEHLGYVQIDTISVVERAHHHVVYSRVPDYQPDMLNTLLQQKHIFEYWSHAAAFLPINDFRFSLPYKHAIKSGQVHWFKTPDKKLMREVLARIRSEGPLRSRDLEHAPGKRAGWWDWKRAKKALEQLYMQGDLMVASREGFEKAYDLPERVLPKGIDTRLPTAEAFAEHLLDQQLACNGLVTLKGLTYLRRDTALRAAMKSLVATRLAEGSLDEFRLQSGEIFVAAPDLLERKPQQSNAKLQILSPFDNAVIQRERLKALFDFDYQIECYVPAPKRHYGYFCLPLLYQNTFVGRIDCKAHRKTRTLEIIALHFDLPPDDALLKALAKALEQFRRFQHCDDIRITATQPVSAAAPLLAALEALGI